MLLAKTDVTLQRSPRIQIQYRTVVDTPTFFNVRTSPLVIGERSEPGFGQFEYTRGMIHPSVKPAMRYPTLNGLQYIASQLDLTKLTALLQQTCFCPPRWWTVPNATCFAWLCEVVERSVITMFLPVDSGWEWVCPETANFLFSNKDAAAETIMYWILGPLTVTGNCTTGKRHSDGSCAPVGAVSTRPAGFGTEPAKKGSGFASAFSGSGSGVGGLAGGRWLQGQQQKHSEGSQPLRTEAATEGSSQRSLARRLQLGQVNGSTGDAWDDVIDWTRPVDAYVGVIPFPSYLYEAQIGDMVAVAPESAPWSPACQSAAFGTFAPLFNSALIDRLVAPFLLSNASDFLPLFPEHRRHGLSGLFDGFDWHNTLGLHPSEADAFAGHPSGPHHTHHHNATCFFPLDNASWAVEDLGIQPAQLAFSHAPLGDGWGTDYGFGKHRRLWASDGFKSGEGLIVTGIDQFQCLRPDPFNWAQIVTDATSGSADIETLNALLIRIDQPVFPSNVLLRMRQLGIRPFSTSPAPESTPPPRQGCPYSPVMPGSLARLILALQLAETGQGFLP